MRFANSGQTEQLTSHCLSCGRRKQPALVFLPWEIPRAESLLMLSMGCPHMAQWHCQISPSPQWATMILIPCRGRRCLALEAAAASRPSGAWRRRATSKLPLPARLSLLREGGSWRRAPAQISISVCFWRLPLQTICFPSQIFYLLPKHFPACRTIIRKAMILSESFIIWVEVRSTKDCKKTLHFQTFCTLPFHFLYGRPDGKNNYKGAISGESFVYLQIFSNGDNYFGVYWFLPCPAWMAKSIHALFLELPHPHCGESYIMYYQKLWWHRTQ